MASQSAFTFTPANDLLSNFRCVENQRPNQELPAEENAEISPKEEEVQRQDVYAPLAKWEIAWKKNYFAATQNIYEPRGDKYLCTKCGEMFPTRLSILTHSKMHLTPFCVVCGIYTETKSAMEFHMRREHKALTYYRNILAPDPEKEIPGSVITPKEIYETNKLRKALYANKKRHKKTGAVSVKQPEHITKTVTSRFGRCITVKLPDF